MMATLARLIRPTACGLVGRINVAPSGIYTLLFAVKTRSAEQELRQQRHRTTGCAFGFTGTPCGTGDVQVRPVVLAGKARQEAASGDGTTRTAADIRHIRKVRLQLFLIFITQRQTPCAIAGLLR